MKIETGDSFHRIVADIETVSTLETKQLQDEHRNILQELSSFVPSNALRSSNYLGSTSLGILVKLFNGNGSLVFFLVVETRSFSKYMKVLYFIMLHLDKVA